MSKLIGLWPAGGRSQNDINKVEMTKNERLSKSRKRRMNGEQEIMGPTGDAEEGDEDGDASR